MPMYMGKSAMPQSDPQSSDSRMKDSNLDCGDLEGTTLDSGSRDGERHRGSRRHRSNRTSSTFFLESPLTLARRSEPGYSGNSFLPQTSPSSHRKGKRTSDEFALAVPKRHATIDRKHNRQSVGSSPLATSMTNVSPREESSRDGAAQAMSPGTSPASPSVRPPQSIGFDTDPAQIVNLALSLSDSRRRIASGRVVSSKAQRSARVLSRGDLTGDSYRFPQQDMVDSQHYAPQDQRMSSKISAAPGVGRRPSGVTRQPHSQSMERFPGSVMTDIDSTQYEYMPYEISNATLARAEKTRRHFELFAEYLRLLPHLPPLPSQNEPSGSAGNSSASFRKSVSRNRVYNPLQYIRNRKVRFREKCPIDSEADGWENVEAVRGWVDLITSSDEAPNHVPEDCILLPKLDPDERPDTRAQAATPTPSATRVLSGGDSGKPRRPRVDWITSPADFLADAAWLEEGSNKLKIEDRDGKRLFNQDTPLKRVSLQDLEPPIEQPAPTTGKLEDQQMPPAEKLSPHESLPSFKSASSRAHTGADRGRRGHRITSSVHRSPAEPSSREASKSRWRKALSRSSDSSSESSGDEHERHRGRRRFPRLSRKPVENENLNIPPQKIPHSSDKTPQKPTHSSTLAHGATYVQLGDHATAPGSKAQPPVLPFLDTNAGHGRHISPPRKGIRSPSPRSERRQEDIPQSSVATIDGSLGSFNGPQIPDITLNMSPPVSRPVSPTKSPVLRLVDPGKPLAYDRSNSSGLGVVVPIDHSAPELTPHKQLTVSDAPVSNSDSKLALYSEDKSRPSDIYHPESPSKGHRHQGHQESKLRGIFKPARLAELVGNEVSKVGDYIWKKDGSGHSRQSSTASSEVLSDYVDADDDFAEVRRKQKPYLPRFPILSDGPSGLSRKNSKKDLPKYHTSNLPVFVSPPRHDDQNESQPPSEFDSPAQSKIRSQPLESELTNTSQSDSLLKPFIPGSDADGDTSRKGSFVGSVASNDNDDLYRQVSRDRLPVTGLTNLTVTPTGQRRPTISESTRNWSMSSLSINGLNRIDRREISRVRAHLLSSGIKALEICRQTDTIRDSPPVLVVRTDPKADGNVPRVPRSEEVTTTARHLMCKFDREVCQVQYAMSKFSSSTSPALKSRLDDLDSLVTSTLSPRIRALTVEADKLTSELATTNTLALKQLNNSLDKGLRKRRRRFRWVSRVGFVMLEWVLVGAMWWLWLVVMVFKIFRGLWRGTVSGIRWVLWI
ncbi:hypothetical protein BDBG_02398 [Blastomyces gilchristii SLH14081]|uniref:Uncharacterized protein n=1 Tax=Blastomyces gilchristii (strain SLH14081) TaxID=559298 RepID=A0A179UDN0_BLAGS|nr:uncharacterized protein BDBG_02398 [Blastomyces gilchristii SLH14081]OAT06116.1 hypothetical protein BDBG_02398 [Blastomyces gilchristii SLH14081]